MQIKQEKTICDICGKEINTYDRSWWHIEGAIKKRYLFGPKLVSEPVDVCWVCWDEIAKEVKARREEWSE